MLLLLLLFVGREEKFTDLLVLPKPPLAGILKIENFSGF
jgi:hypothetical protein